MMACHARLHMTLCVVQGRWWHMPHPTLSHRVCYARAKMACDAWRVQLRVLPNYHDGMPCSTSSDHVCIIKWNVKLNGIKHFNHKICYLTLNLKFSDVLPRYFELKNLCSFIRFIAIKNNYFFQNWGNSKLNGLKDVFLENWLFQTAYGDLFHRSQKNSHIKIKIYLNRTSK